MHNTDPDKTNQRAFRAGLFYLLIIAFGVGGAMLIRAPMLDMQDLPGSVARMAASALPFRLSILADLIMAIADVGLAIVLFQLFRPVDSRLSMAAMIFRLLQAAIIALNLVNLSLAIACAEQGDVVWTLRLLGAHDAGYALALIFFAASSALLARLVAQQNFVPRVFAPALWIIAVLYAGGSIVRIAAPDWTMSIAPVYLVTFIIELSLCLWLLSRGINFKGRLRSASVVAAPVLAIFLSAGGCATEQVPVPARADQSPKTMCCDCDCSDGTDVCLNVVTRSREDETCGVACEAICATQEDCPGVDGVSTCESETFPPPDCSTATDDLGVPCRVP